MLCLSIPAAGADDAEDANADIDIEAEHWVFVPEASLGQNALTPPCLPTRSSSSSTSSSPSLPTYTWIVKIFFFWLLL